MTGKPWAMPHARASSLMGQAVSAADVLATAQTTPWPGWVGGFYKMKVRANSQADHP